MDRLDLGRIGSEGRLVVEVRPPPGQLDFPGGDALPEPPRRADGDAKFLADLADKGFRFTFARLDPSAGKAVGQRGDELPERRITSIFSPRRMMATAPRRPGSSGMTSILPMLLTSKIGILSQRSATNGSEPESTATRIGRRPCRLCYHGGVRLPSSGVPRQEPAGQQERTDRMGRSAEGKTVCNHRSVTPKVVLQVKTNARLMTTRPRFFFEGRNQRPTGQRREQAEVFRSVAGPKTNCQHAQTTRTNSNSRWAERLRRACQRQSPTTIAAEASCTAK